MKIAFVGHPYHQKTRSADFFTDLLLEAGFDIEFIYDDFFYTNESTCMERLLDGNHDAIYLWQTEYLAPQLLRARKRVAAIPMFDAARLHRPEFWNSISLVRVICFCRALHNQLQERQLDSNYFQFFPNPDLVPDTSAYGLDREKPHGFAWLRRPWDGVAWEDVRSIFNAIGTGSGQLHVAIDDDDNKHEIVLPSDDEVARYNLELSDWYPEKNDLRDAKGRADFYVSPRYFEGIGFSFLEAMAMGICPVSSNTPTMSEYIYHGENGLLFDAGSEHRLPRLSAPELCRLGARARESIRRGHERWEIDKPRLIDRLFALSRPPARRRDFSSQMSKLAEKRDFPALASRSVHPELAAPSPAQPKAPRRYLGRMDRPENPKLTIVTVVKDDAAGLKRTLESVACQTFLDFEYIVLDGRSAVDLMDEVGPLANLVDEFISQADDGPYDAMVRGAELARGTFVYFLNAGDVLYARDTLERAMAAADDDVDFVYGDHVWVRKDGAQLHHRARTFEWTWETLQKGYLTGEWLSGIPAHQATFTRTELIKKYRYDLRYIIAADHEFMFRMRSQGAQFRHCMETVALYYEGGMSSNRFKRCQAEWYEIAHTYGAGDGIHDFYGPALGYDLRYAGLVGSGEKPKPKPNGNGHMIVDANGRRDRMAELAGRLAHSLPRESVRFRAARGIWHMIRPERSD